jgi:hypothetical protein
MSSKNAKQARQVSRKIARDMHSPKSKPSWLEYIPLIGIIFKKRRERKHAAIQARYSAAVTYATRKVGKTILRNNTKT